ncbi:bifunctional 5,10-methylenetetrahydrofolate dehydrogenase/5,10-methenyltetrahydrofolate cyclohydrolase [Microgenomates group bacterium]|nr:bifunctional 5,10-methylenetetrahydrofolate dehydrogenase/5,10-methenyltetrahydrofolate cyclohydrolase [Microgenomates group bacterium]
MTTIFDGEKLAATKLQALKKQTFPPLTIAALVFSEDDGGQLYTRKKSELAAQLNITYLPTQMSINTDLPIIQSWIEKQNASPKITGLIVQKPMRRVYESTTKRQDFAGWWANITSHISPAKDIDGLNPATTAVISATASAVLSVLTAIGRLKNRRWQTSERVVIIGKSDLLGFPLHQALTKMGADVSLWGKKELASQTSSSKAIDQEIIISATGIPNLIKGSMISEGAILIDVGEPQGDVDVPSVLNKASFLTPVPHGIGPLTVVSLMENAVRLANI